MAHELMADSAVELVRMVRLLRRRVDELCTHLASLEGELKLVSYKLAMKYTNDEIVAASKEIDAEKKDE